MDTKIRNPPLDIINQLAVKRAGDAEYGPLDLYGIMKHGKRYTLEYDYKHESIRVKETKSKSIAKAKKKNALPHSICAPLSISRFKWISHYDLTIKQRLQHVGDVAKNGNVFGEVGIISIPRKYNMNIPMINALDCEHMLFQEFGIRLFRPGQTLPNIAQKGQTLYMVSYRLNAHFASEYVHKTTSGPGIFLEHHRFPHYITPVSHDARGPIVVGSFERVGSFDNGGSFNNTGKRLKLIGVNIPVGFTLYLPANTIHNDWYFIGKLATTVMLDDKADTVYVRGFHSKRIAMDFFMQPGNV